jgi:hypothetical protein
VTTLVDLIAELRAAKKCAEAAIERAAAARTKIEKAEHQFTASARGSGRPEARATPQGWAAAREHLDKTIGRLLTGGHAVDAYIDLLGGGAAGTAGVGEASTAGSRDVPEPKDRASRRTRLRRELVRRGDEVVDATHDTTDAIRNLLPGGPGPAKTHTVSPAAPPGDLQPGVPDYAAGLLAGGIVAAEGAAKVGRALRRLKETHAQQNG